MTLGERIAYHRNRLGLSQGELAGQMNVSRQAVSKWETDGSLPDLDRLIALSGLFGITLDELVKGEEQEPADPAAAESPGAPVPRPAAQGQRTVGYVLLGVGLLAAVLGLVFNPAVLIPAAYLLLCAILCLAMRRDAGYVIGGMTLGTLFWGAPYVMGFGPAVIFNPILYSGGPIRFSALYLAAAFLLWGLMLWYLWALLRRLGKTQYTLPVWGWAILLFGLRGHLLRLWDGGLHNLTGGELLPAATANLLAAALVFFTLRAVLRRRRPKKEG